MNEGSLVLDSLTEVIEMLEKVRAEKAASFVTDRAEAVKQLAAKLEKLTH